jgi:polar amino acid transport system substrate-binding protein
MSVAWFTYCQRRLSVPAYKILFFALFLCQTVFSGALKAETITLVADAWPPFNGIPESNREGYMVDIVREIFTEQGYGIHYKLLPWKRAVAETRKGNFDGVIGASPSDAVGFIFPEQELTRNVLSFYVKKDNPWKYTGVESLQQLSLGVIHGYDYRQWLNDYVSKHSKDKQQVQIVTGEDPLRRNLKKLINNRLDVIVDNEAAIRSVAKSMGILADIKAAGYGTEPSFCYIAFTPNRPSSKQYADILSQGIISMRKSGRLQEILDKYGLQDWRAKP